MKLSPPLAITGIIAASFAWMAWEYEPVYHGHGYWICEADGLPADINGKPRQCPQFDGVNHPPPNGIPHARKKTTTLYYIGVNMDGPTHPNKP